MSYNVKNYTEQGGEKTVIGGTLEVKDGATVSGITGVAATANATTLGGIKASPKDAGDTVEVKINGTTAKLYVPTYPEGATTEIAGLVKQATNVDGAAGESPTKAEFDALIAALVAAGIMAGAE